jgi:cytochrome c5
MNRGVYRALARIAFGLAVLSAGCAEGSIAGESEPTIKVSRELEPLTLHSIDWNVAKADVGTIAAIAEDDEELVLFGSNGATLMAGGAVRGVIAGATSWHFAGTIPAADGVGDWIIGVAGDGHIYRVRAESLLEDVSGRYGLSTDLVRSVVGIDHQSVAFGFEGGLAIADGTTVTRYAGPPNGMLSGGSGRLAWRDDTSVKVLTLAARKVRSFDLAGATGVAIDASGRLVVIEDRRLWIESDGVLSLRWTADAPFGAITTAGPRVWMSVGTELAVATGDALSKSSGAGVVDSATLSGTPTGDVWIVGSDGVRKLSGSAPSEAIADWIATIQPIYATTCASCHAPSGAAGSDLSTHQAWLERSDAIRQRVVIDQTMPPRGIVLDDSKRAAIRDWLERNKR